MRIYRERIPGISSSVVKALSANELIEGEPISSARSSST